MRHLPIIAAVLGLICLASSGCKEVVLQPQPINPLYKTIYDYPSYGSAQKDSVVKADSLELDLMFQILGKKFVWQKVEEPVFDRHHELEYREEEAAWEKEKDLPTILEVMAQWSESPAVRLFVPAVNEVYPNLENVEESLGLLLQNAQSKGLDLPNRRYVAVVWGYKQSIVFADSIMFLAMNHFLGENFAGYSDMPLYERALKTPEQLPYSIAEALIGNRYPYELTDMSTVLSRIMYEGAMTYAKLKIVPNATLASTLGYTTDQLEWLDSHYKEIWETLIGKDMLYSTQRDIADRLVKPAPSASLISPEAPGRVGRYIGYRLIINYLDNNAKATIPEILSPAFYNDPSELVLAQ